MSFENRVNSRFELRFIFTHFLESAIIDGSDLDVEDKKSGSTCQKSSTVGVLVLTVLTLSKRQRYLPHKWIHVIYFS